EKLPMKTELQCANARTARTIWFLLIVVAVATQTRTAVAQARGSKGASASKVDIAGEPTDFGGPSDVIVAAVRNAWRSVLAPDETWIATGYGLNAGDAGRLRVWDLKNGQVKWEAREGRGI